MQIFPCSSQILSCSSQIFSCYGLDWECYSQIFLYLGPDFDMQIFSCYDSEIIFYWALDWVRKISSCYGKYWEI